MYKNKYNKREEWVEALDDLKSVSINGNSKYLYELMDRKGLSLWYDDIKKLIRLSYEDSYKEGYNFALDVLKEHLDTIKDTTINKDSLYQYIKDAKK